MLKFKNLLICILVPIFILSGCKNPHNSSVDFIIVEDKKFTAKEIIDGIKDTFNANLYNVNRYDTNLMPNQAQILNKELVFDLFFEDNSNTDKKEFVYPPKIYLVITNISHPTSTNDNPQFYKFGIDITKCGLRSDFYFEGHTDANYKSFFEEQDALFLGTHTMRLEKVEKPQYEKMSDQWKNKVTKAVKLYMDNIKNSDENLLISGEYRICVKGFFKSDCDTLIYFEHENGNLYCGYYHFIHDVDENIPANINKLALLDDAKNKELNLENIYSNAAISIYYLQVAE